MQYDSIRGISRLNPIPCSWSALESEWHVNKLHWVLWSDWACHFIDGSLRIAYTSRSAHIYRARRSVWSLWILCWLHPPPLLCFYSPGLLTMAGTTDAPGRGNGAQAASHSPSSIAARSIRRPIIISHPPILRRRSRRQAGTPCFAMLNPCCRSKACRSCIQELELNTKDFGFGFHGRIFI